MNDIHEAVELRRLGLHVPIYVCGPLGPGEASLVVDVQARVVVTRMSQVEELAAAGRASEHQIPLHVKIETGCNRQGVDPGTALELVRTIWETEGVIFEGLTTHFADVEDTTDNTSHKTSWRRSTVSLITSSLLATNLESGTRPIRPPRFYGHMLMLISCVLVSRHTVFGPHGKAPYATALEAGSDSGWLHPQTTTGLSWYTRVAEVKHVSAGSYIGYGRTYRTTQIQLQFYR